MKVRQLIKGLLERDLYDLYLFIIWYARPGRVSCIDCIKTCKEMSGNIPDCSKCGNPTATALKKYFSFELRNIFQNDFDTYKPKKLSKDEKELLKSSFGEEVIVDETYDT